MEPDVLDILQDILEADRTFSGSIGLLNGATRNHVVIAHQRNMANALSILRLFMSQPPPTAVVTISMDTSGNFFDPVPVAPSREEIVAATETHRTVPANTTCSICQDEVTSATRIRACGHSFHGACLDQWLQINPRCPVCRHDIRNLQPTATVTHNAESSRLHSNP